MAKGPTMLRLLPTIAAAAMFGTVALFADAAFAQPIGVMTAFQTDISRAGSGALGVGADIFLGDHLFSNETGLGMIVFDDESSAKIGPNAELVIDTFVYDPASGNGNSSIQLNSGLIRLYGGQISKDGGMQIQTPHVVLGVRGGIAEAFTEGDTSIAILRAGILICIHGDTVKVISNPGFGCMWDGIEFSVSEFPLDLFEILDSLDEVAGNNTPGPLGGGLDTDAICASVLGPALGFCQSADGGLPGGGPGNGPSDTPQGGTPDDECCDGDYCCDF